MKKLMNFEFATYKEHREFNEKQLDIDKQKGIKRMNGENMRKCAVESNTFINSIPDNNVLVQSQKKVDDKKSDKLKELFGDLILISQQPKGMEGILKIFKIPLKYPKPYSYTTHQCSVFCMSKVEYDYKKTKYMTVLSIPLHFGFNRYIKININSNRKKVIYTTPCGLQIDNEDEMNNYLKVTAINDSQMTIDLFNFDCWINPLSLFSVPNKYIRTADISNNLEFKTISVANRLHDTLPPNMKYITEREPSPGVNLNSEFLCGCDCSDNCQDKTKCSCWKLTYETPKNNPKYFNDLNIGYNYKRLHNRLITGIYECYDHCKCKKSCLNRVVQEPMKSSLQMFYTVKKGWGVRTLTDIPKASFVCTMVGKISPEKNKENGRVIKYNKYLADLDFIKTAVQTKDGYESFAEQDSDEDLKNKSSSKDSDEEYTHSWKHKSDIRMSEPRKSRRIRSQKSLQNTNTNIDSKYELSKLETHQTVEFKPKSLLSSLEKDLHTLDLKDSGNIGRYFNHSCDPNMFVQNVFVDTHDLRFPWVALFAKTGIPAGTELTWDYGYNVGSIPNKKIICYCGAEKCNGRLL